MDVVTELTARLSAYIGLLQDALALLRPGHPDLEGFDPAFEGPVLLRLNPNLLSEAQVRPEGLLWQKFYDHHRLLSGAMELAAPDKDMMGYKHKPGEGLHQEMEKELKLFAHQAHQLLVHVLLPNKESLVKNLTGSIFCAGPVEKAASGSVAGIYNLMAFLPPEPWRRAIRTLLYEKPETRLALVEALGRSKETPSQPSLSYEPLLVQKAREIIAEKKKFKKKALRKQHELTESILYVLKVIRLQHKESESSGSDEQLALLQEIGQLEQKIRLLKHGLEKGLAPHLEEGDLAAHGAEIIRLQNKESKSSGTGYQLVQLQEKLSLVIRILAEGLTPQLESELLVADSIRDEVLSIGECALPFEVVFRQELEEVRGRRKVVRKPDPASGAEGAGQATATARPAAAADALQNAATLQLCGLAFSGGGIRSATFNLGILQGLASRGWLPHFDYLSTVSGGSYLGSWLSAWIKRAGSLEKVAARLCPDLSPEPRAEEVRPIRWLRMYSNYLAPNPSIMSADSWTLGGTWLRNAILNQIIFVLALGAVLACGAALLQGWRSLYWQEHPLFWQVLIPLLLLLGAGVSGLGMSMFRTGHTWPPKLKVKLLVIATVIMALVGAFLVSGLLHNQYYPGFARGFENLMLIVPVGAFALLLVAILGRYDRCFYAADDQKQERAGKTLLAWGAISVTSVAAAAIGLVALILVWKGLYGLHQAPGTELYSQMRLSAASAGKLVPLGFSMVHLAFVIGLPLVLEVLVVTVVVRMALLGANFPDERREWWGRMGAVVHLAAVVWLVLTGSILLSSPVLVMVREYVTAKIVATGWIALVISGVQFAHSARTPAQADKPGAGSWLDRITSLAPYAFGLGLLLLTAAGINFLLNWLLIKLPQWGIGSASLVQVALGLSGVLGLLALLLSWRVEVNEFSLHHFYRNRLGRAYLGASRRRTERNKTANPFTSFDRRDDLKICSLRQNDPLATDQSYDGPYLIINTTLNTTQTTDLAQQDRKAESFVFTPRYCGFDFVRVRAVNPKQPSFDFGYRPTHQYAYPQDNGPALSTAMTISGAATNPNRGYHSSPASAFLLALFNVRLGWWMGNPRREETWGSAAPPLGLFYLLSELFGRSTTSNRYVNLSDGGHFDNMGLYELVRRRCCYIILGDGEEDHRFTCEGLANAIRRCRVDFGVEIRIDVTPITNREGNISKRHYAVGTIHYPDDLPGARPGYLLYLKTSLTDDEPADVREYAKKNETFPHQPTRDQFFSEPQFESYRRLGLHVVEKVLMVLEDGHDLDAAFSQLLAEEAKNRMDKEEAPS